MSEQTKTRIMWTLLGVMFLGYVAMQTSIGTPVGYIFGVATTAIMFVYAYLRFWRNW